MNKVVLLTLVGTLAFLTEGCSVFTKFSELPTAPKNTVKPVPVPTNNAQTQPQQTESEVFADLEEPLPEIAGLIPATDPDARVRTSVRGRKDPFSVVTLNPRIQIEEEDDQDENFSSNRVSSRVNNNDNSRSNSRDDLDTSSSDEEVFEPALARNVVVSGLFEANGKTRLIVQAPEESSSRYVEVGQYLSNGQILVKRIDDDHISGPIIILEQSGMEVAKKIGADLSEDNYADDYISKSPIAPSQDWNGAISLK